MARQLLYLCEWPFATCNNNAKLALWFPIDNSFSESHWYTKRQFAFEVPICWYSSSFSKLYVPMLSSQWIDFTILAVWVHHSTGLPREARAVPWELLNPRYSCKAKLTGRQPPRASGGERILEKAQVKCSRINSHTKCFQCWKKCIFRLPFFRDGCRIVSPEKMKVTDYDYDKCGTESQI